MPQDMASEFIADAEKNYAGCFWTKIQVESKLKDVLTNFQPDYVVADIKAMQEELVSEIKRFYFNEIIFYKRRIKELEGLRS